MLNTKTIAIFLLISTLLGCSNSKIFTRNTEPKKTVSTSEAKSIFYKDGQKAFYLVCEGPGWSECVQQAGDACQNKGYDVLEKNTVKIPHTFTSDKTQNEMYITCKVPEEPVKK